MDISEMSNNEYLEYKRAEYYKKHPFTEDMVEEEKHEIDSNYKSLENQIKSGMLIGIALTDIEKYATDEYDYKKREFIKSCILEDVSDDVINKIIRVDDIKDMIFLKATFYKDKNVKEYITSSILPEINTVKGVVGDCENKFSAFEKLLSEASEKISEKDKEIKELNIKIQDLMEDNHSKDIIITNFNNELKNNYEDGNNAQTFEIDLIIEEEMPDPEPLEPIEEEIPAPYVVEDKKGDKKADGKHFKLFKKDIKKVPDNDDEDDVKEVEQPKKQPQSTPSPQPKSKKYVKKKITKTIDNFDQYMLDAKLSAKQLNSITQCIMEFNISNKNIAYMIENKLDSDQIYNYGRLMYERYKVAEERMKKKNVENTNNTSNNAVISSQFNEAAVEEEDSDGFND